MLLIEGFDSDQRTYVELEVPSERRNVQNIIFVPSVKCEARSLNDNEADEPFFTLHIIPYPSDSTKFFGMFYTEEQQVTLLFQRPESST